MGRAEAREEGRVREAAEVAEAAGGLLEDVKRGLASGSAARSAAAASAAVSDEVSPEAVVAEALGVPVAAEALAARFLRMECRSFSCSATS